MLSKIQVYIALSLFVTDKATRIKIAFKSVLKAKILLVLVHPIV